MENIIKLTLRDSYEIKESMVMDQIADDEIINAIHEIQRKERAASIEAAAKEIYQLNIDAVRKIKEEILRIRNLKKEIAKSKQEIDKIQKALAYGKETRNYIPLLNTIQPNAITNIDFTQYDPNKDHTEYFYIPSDWEPSTPIEKIKVDC